MSGYWYRENRGVLFMIRPTLFDLNNGLHWQHREDFCFTLECCICGRLTPEYGHFSRDEIHRDSTGRPLFQGIKIGHSAYEYSVCEHCAKDKTKIATVVYQCSVCKKYVIGMPKNRSAFYVNLPRRHGGIVRDYYENCCKPCSVKIRKLADDARDCVEIEKLINKIKRTSCVR